MVCGFSQSFVDYLFICRILIQYSRRRQWQPTPVLLPGKSHGWRSLVGCSPWGCEESDDWATSLSLFTFTHWRRKWQPTPVFLPGESQGWGSLWAAVYGIAHSRTQLKRLSSSSSSSRYLKLVFHRLVLCWFNLLSPLADELHLFPCLPLIPQFFLWKIYYLVTI